MKALLTIFVLAYSCSSFAWISKDAVQKEYTFKYKLSGQSFEIKKQAQSYEDAYRVAAQQCFNHFKGAGKVSEERGLDIIDVCANPRS
ncbi:hypothetical protein [Bdellovibrio sp. HCB288]|uniref:hypothetical protein n=1 Tax=Bdellovibrio sp. HCB288 TaxID=3394355 RepID=UPI0039B538F6